MFLRKIQNYIKIENKVVHLQSSIENYPSSEYLENLLKQKYSIDFIKLNTENTDSINEWISVINNAYDDANYDYQKGKQQLTDHLFLTNTETFLFFYNKIAIATISIGIYKENKNIGGTFRIAVRKQFQNKGIARNIVILAYAKLKERGIKYSEVIISSKRTESLMLHFKLGFIPQYNMKYIAYKNAIKSVNFLQKYKLYKKLHRLHKEYTRNFNSYFI